MKIIPFNELGNCDLVIDAVYEGGIKGNIGDDPISKIFPVGNQGGFRFSGTIEKINYIILYTSGEDVDWPDTIDTETGIFKYYGDNKSPGTELHDTKKKGNWILKTLFESMSAENNPRITIPPIFIFRKFPTPKSSRSVQFKGLCVPGTNQRSPIDNLVAVWKTSNGFRFQNYAAYFTILDIALIKTSWLESLTNGQFLTIDTPTPFKQWINNGIYHPLTSKKTVGIRTIEEQMPQNKIEKVLLQSIFEYFITEPTLFEFFAADLYHMTSPSIIIDEVTSRTLDGGRDALGRLKLGIDKDPIFVEFALEAKCYNPGLNEHKTNTVGVKETSRLISRIRNRQYGVLVTTSAISKQAYEEVRKDGHPIILLSGGDIVKILIDKGINSRTILIKYLIDNYKKSIRINDII
jgi:hypothetical protein